MTQEITVYEPNPAALALVGDPEAALEGAARAAKALIRMVDQTNSFTVINGRKHLRVEAWQTLGAFYGVTAIIPRDGVRDLLDDDGTFTGVEAYAEARHGGIVIGGASARCLINERTWRDRERNQIASMAQTRATSKALRTVLAWVVVLAGYEATPAEEMTQDAAAAVPRRNVGNVRTDVIEGEVVRERPRPTINDPDSPATERQVKAIYTIAHDRGWTDRDVHLHMETMWNITGMKDMTKGLAGEFIDHLQNNGRPATPPIADEQAELIPAPRNLH